MRIPLLGCESLSSSASQLRGSGRGRANAGYVAVSRQSTPKSSDERDGLEGCELLDAGSSARWRWTRAAACTVLLLSLVPALHGVRCATLVRRGLLIRTPVYSDVDIAQAGWTRPSYARSNMSSFRSSNASSNPRITPFQAVNMDRHVSGTGSNTQIPPDDMHVLILTPLRNAEVVLPDYFALLGSLKHPKANTSLGFLVGDEEDNTASMIQEWILQQSEKNDYHTLSLIRKEFGMTNPTGEARHLDWIQSQRRKLMAKARTLLVTSLLTPDIDWVLWLDSDIKEAPPSLISDLLEYGKIDENGHSRTADVITPNIMQRSRKYPSHLGRYDLNNWAETPESLALIKPLPSHEVLHEGDKWFPIPRVHLVSKWVMPNISSHWDRSSPGYPYDASQGPSDLYDPTTPAWVGRTMALDGVGGVALLVNANVHRYGAVFPSWPVDHAVETEGFGKIAHQLLGINMVGLPNYLVYHQN